MLVTDYWRVSRQRVIPSTSSSKTYSDSVEIATSKPFLLKNIAKDMWEMHSCLEYGRERFGRSYWKTRICPWMRFLFKQGHCILHTKMRRSTVAVRWYPVPSNRVLTMSNLCMRKNPIFQEQLLLIHVRHINQTNSQNRAVTSAAINDMRNGANVQRERRNANCVAK